MAKILAFRPRKQINYQPTSIDENPLPQVPIGLEFTPHNIKRELAAKYGNGVEEILEYTNAGMIGGEVKTSPRGNNRLVVLYSQTRSGRKGYDLGILESTQPRIIGSFRSLDQALSIYSAALSGMPTEWFEHTRNKIMEENAISLLDQRLDKSQVDRLEGLKSHIGITSYTFYGSRLLCYDGRAIGIISQLKEKGNYKARLIFPENRTNKQMVAFFELLSATLSKQPKRIE